MIIHETGHAAAGIDAHPMQFEFKDGIHTVSEAVVTHLGGNAVLERQQNSFKDKTYKEFMSAFWKLVEKTRLNDIGEKFKSGHFTNQDPWSKF